MAIQFLCIKDSDGSLAMNGGTWIDPRWYPPAGYKFLVRANATSQWKRANAVGVGYPPGYPQVAEIESATGQWKYETL